MVTVEPVKLVLASPLVPEPSEVSVNAAVPLRAPATLVFSPTIRLLPLVAPAPSRLIEPLLVVALPVAPPRLASSFSE